jgi:FK506-binding protein 2
MQLFNWLPYFILAIVLPVLAKKKAPKDLVIKTVYKPKECTTTAMSGDSIQVHYVRLLPPVTYIHS